MPMLRYRLHRRNMAKRRMLNSTWQALCNFDGECAAMPVELK
jgi:hypothetical protein